MRADPELGIANWFGVFFLSMRHPVVTGEPDVRRFGLPYTVLVVWIGGVEGKWETPPTSIPPVQDANQV